MRKWCLLLGGVLFILAAKQVSAEVDLSGYCKDGYYKIPNESVCSRAPNCGGYGYDELNVKSKMPDYNACMGNGDAERSTKGCAGYVPLCCYEVARTGQYTKCIGYWERLWCTKTQCKQAEQRGASNDECGGSCQCGHAFNDYCGSDKQAVPIEQRLGMSVPPTATPTAKPTTSPTRIPTQFPTSIPTGGSQPTTQPTAIQPTSTATGVPTSSVQVPTVPFVPQNEGGITPFPTSSLKFALPKLQLRTSVPPEVVAGHVAQILDAPKEVTYGIIHIDQTIEATAQSWIARIIQSVREALL